MNAQVATNFVNELDHLNRLILQCDQNIDKFMTDDSEAGRHWFTQFQLESIRLRQQKAALVASR